MFIIRMHFLILMLALISCSHQSKQMERKKSYNQNKSYSCFQDKSKEIINYLGSFSDEERYFIRLKIFPQRQYFKMNNFLMLNEGNSMIQFESNKLNEMGVITKKCILKNSLGQSIFVTTEKLQKISYF